MGSGCSRQDFLRTVNRPFLLSVAVYTKFSRSSFPLAMNLSELTFHKHPAGFQAVARFENSYGLSIVPESNGEHYEVAVLFNGRLCYDSGLTKDVFRYVTVDSIDDLAAVARSL
jgi:hypothetical protein